MAKRATTRPHSRSPEPSPLTMWIFVDCLVVIMASLHATLTTFGEWLRHHSPLPNTTRSTISGASGSPLTFVSCFGGFQSSPLRCVR